MRRAPIIAVFMLPALLAACGPGNKQGTGTIVGAVAGGAAGAAIGGPRNRGAGLAIGAVVGGILGNQIGRSLDEEDRQMAAAAEYQALEYGQPGAATPWDNPQTQHRGQIVATTAAMTANVTTASRAGITAIEERWHPPAGKKSLR